MTKTPHRRLRAVLAAGAVAAALPVAAQEFDSALGVEPVAILQDGRLLVQNGDTLFDCVLAATDTGAALADCTPRDAASDAVAMLVALDDAEWQAFVRQTMIDSECRLSALGAIAQVVGQAAEAHGVAPDVLARMGADLTARAEAAVDRMIREGLVSYRGGELALDDCD
jgi:hypothetical protein